jgi:hypothetical protein
LSKREVRRRAKQTKGEGKECRVEQRGGWLQRAESLAEQERLSKGAGENWSRVLPPNKKEDSCVARMPGLFWGHSSSVLGSIPASDLVSSKLAGILLPSSSNVGNGRFIC